MELTKKEQFKVGMRVKFELYGEYGTGTIIDVGEHKARIDVDNLGTRGIDFKYYSNGASQFKNIKTLERTLDDPQVGDILVDKDGDECRVLAVCGELVGISSRTDHRSHSAWKDTEYIKEYLKIKGEPEEKKYTITLDGKEMEISEEDYQKLKKQFNN